MGKPRSLFPSSTPLFFASLSIEDANVQISARNILWFSAAEALFPSALCYYIRNGCLIGLVIGQHVDLRMPDLFQGET